MSLALTNFQRLFDRIGPALMLTLGLAAAAAFSAIAV